MTQALATRNHPTYWAFVVHRVSGLALALFLPVHLYVLSLALKGAAALDDFLRWTDMPLVKVAESVLVLLLAAHMAGLAENAHCGGRRGGGGRRPVVSSRRVLMQW